MAADKILMRRGLEADLPDLDEGEFGWTTDTEKLYMGTASSANVLINGAVSVDLTEIFTALDGYSSISGAGVSTADGYVAFFTGSKTISGDNDLFFNRTNHTLTLGSGGTYLGADGTVNRVSYGTGAADVGLYRNNSGNLGFVVNGTEWFYMDGSGFLNTQSGGLYRAGNGNLVNTAFASNSSSNSGLYFPAGTEPAIASSGTEVARFTIDSISTQSVLDAYGDIQVQNTRRILLPTVNDLTRPTISFGDGDSGFTESADDVLQIIAGGQQAWVITAAVIGADSFAGGPFLLRQIASDTMPTLVPSSSDFTTGIGLAQVGSLSLIAGSNEGLRINSDGSVYLGEANLYTVLDGYAGGVQLTSGFTGADGYVAFFTGNNAVAGDNDLYYNRVTGDLTIGGAGTLITARVVGDGAVLNLGASAITGHSLAADDVLVGGQLEVNNVIWADGGMVSSVAIEAPRFGASSALLHIGDSSPASGHGLGAGDVLFPGSVEINGMLWADGGITTDGYVNVKNDLYVDDRLFLTQTVGSAESPAISFGDGDTGFYESADDVLQVAIAGINTWTITSTVIGAEGVVGAAFILRVPASSTQPTIIPSSSDFTSGIGADGVGAISVIANSMEGMRVYASGASTYVDLPDGYLSASQNEMHLYSSDGYVVIHSDLEVIGQIYSNIPAELITDGDILTINWNEGNAQLIDLENATADVSVTMINAAPGASYILRVRQDSTTPRNLIWPENVLWSDGITPVISTGADAIDIVSLFFDGFNFYGNVGANYS